MTKRTASLVGKLTLVMMVVSPLWGQQPAPQPKPMANDVYGPWVWRYTPMQEPHFVPAAQAAFMKNDSYIIGLSVNGVSKAYQDFVVHEHHMVRDEIGKIPVFVTWCGLCGTAMVFRAEIDGKSLTADLAGLRGLNWVMRDRQTGSLWQQATGLAFDGPMKGKRLQLVDFLLTTWGEWRKVHPDTLALMPDPTHAEGYKQMEVAHARQRKLSSIRIRKSIP